MCVCVLPYCRLARLGGVVMMVDEERARGPLLGQNCFLEFSPLSAAGGAHRLR